MIENTSIWQVNNMELFELEFQKVFKSALEELIRKKIKEDTYIEWKDLSYLSTEFEFEFEGKDFCLYFEINGEWDDSRWQIIELSVRYEVYEKGNELEVKNIDISIENNAIFNKSKNLMFVKRYPIEGENLFIEKMITKVITAYFMHLLNPKRSNINVKNDLYGFKDENQTEQFVDDILCVVNELSDGYRSYSKIYNVEQREKNFRGEVIIGSFYSNKEQEKFLRISKILAVFFNNHDIVTNFGLFGGDENRSNYNLIMEQIFWNEQNTVKNVKTFIKGLPQIVRFYKDKVEFCNETLVLLSYSYSEFEKITCDELVKNLLREQKLIFWVNGNEFESAAETLLKKIYFSQEKKMRKSININGVERVVFSPNNNEFAWFKIKSIISTFKIFGEIQYEHLTFIMDEYKKYFYDVPEERNLEFIEIQSEKDRVPDVYLYIKKKGKEIYLPLGKKDIVELETSIDNLPF